MLSTKKSFPIIILVCFLVGSLLLYRTRFTKVAILPQETSLISSYSSGSMQISSPSFQDGDRIPQEFSCEGQNINPPLAFSGVPVGTKSLALIMDDPDIPQIAKDTYHIEEWDHWVVWNIPPETAKIPIGTTPPGVLGNNTRSEPKYQGPCPPDREHRYFFRLYALDTTINLQQGATKKELLQAIQGHIITQAELVGKYEKKH